MWWGLGRGLQLAWCVAVFALLLVACHWWLGRFRYGPLEWAWRWFTYLRVPTMRQDRRLQPA